MSRHTVLRAADRKVRAWKNGGGVTREVAVGGLLPDGSFDWRVSMADVAIAGPFSRFEGIDRTLCVLAGKLSLKVEGTSSVTLDPTSEPFSFAGEAETHGAPLGGGVLDLNVMTRRSGWRAEVERLSKGTSIKAAQILLIVATGRATVGGEELEGFDAYFTLGHNRSLGLASASPIYVVRVNSIGS